MAQRPESRSNAAASGRDATPPAATPLADAAPQTIWWETIAAGKRQVFIRFKDQTYQLRETRNGKLILTK